MPDTSTPTRASEPVDYLANLRLQQGQLQRTSTAERVAVILREHVTDGSLLPGQRLTEDGISAALQVSRNTLREAFRLLSHERLVVHELNRGVFVRELRAKDVVDLYRLRRLLECGVLRELTEQVQDLTGVQAAVQDGERAAEREQWAAVGTANMRFHQALVALADSPRLTEVMRGVLAELRLVFHVMSDPRAFYEPFLARNRELLAVLTTGDGPHAAQLLHAYLVDAEHQLTAAYALDPARSRTAR